MTRTFATGSLAALACAAICLPACETGSGRSYSSSASGPSQSRQVPPSLVGAPSEMRDNPQWVLIDPVRVEGSVRFEEIDPKMTRDALSEYFRREIRDQVVATEHFRVAGEFGERSPLPPKYAVRGTLRRLDVGPEFDADARTGGVVSDVSGKAEQVQTARPVTCEVRLELVATDKADQRVGTPGETVAIGDAEVGFTVSTKFSVVGETPADKEGVKAQPTARPMESVKVQREQIPGSLLRAVRLALNDLLLNARDPVFNKETRLAEADKKADEERARQNQRAEEEQRRQAQKAEEDRKREAERAASQAGVNTETAK